MFSSVDKAIVAVIMAVVYLVNHFFGTELQLDEADVSGAVAVITSVLTPLLVYMIPNKPKENE